MEGKNQHSSSSSSLSAELFGSKDSSSSSSSSGFFNSIFPPPSKVHGKNHISSQTEKNYDFATKQDFANKEDTSRNPKADLSPFYQQISQPCPLSSSIYYGGQEIYTSPPVTNHNPQSTQYNQEGEDDGRASRGNWWQGSLYY